MALIDKASLLMVPSTYEAGKLYNVLPSGNRAPDSTGENSGYDQTRADFDFDRGSNAAATRVNADGLIEKYRENLLLHSNQFDTTWLNYRTTSVGNQSGYDGSNNAWLLTCTNADGNAYQDISLSGVLTFSYYVKAGSVNWTRLRIDSTTTPDLNAWINLTDGSIGTDNGIATYVESVGNGWYRIVGQTNTTGTQRVQIYPSDSDTNNSSSGSIYIQNAQLESGLVATDYLESTSVTGKAGVLIDLPRIDYSSGAGALLLEPSRLNKIQYSEYFGDSSWNNSNEVTRSISEATSPEGVLNAYDIIPTTANTNHTLRAPNLSGFTSGAVVNVSFFAKENGYKFISVVGGFGSSSTSAVVFNLEDGTIESGTGTIEDFGNGWYRCVSPITLNATALYCVGTILNDSQSGSFSGDGVKGISVYGYQIEEASYQTSYIPNHGESGGVTRAADSCSVTGASDVIGQTEGTLFVDVNLDGTITSDQQYIEINDGTTSNRIYIGLYSIYSLFRVVSGGAEVVNINNILTIGNRYKMALTYEANSVKAFINGSKIGEDTSASIPACSRVYLNYNENAQIGVNESIIFTSLLTEAEAIALTTL